MDWKKFQRRLEDVRSWIVTKTKHVAEDKRVRRAMRTGKDKARDVGKRLGDLAGKAAHKVQARIKHS